MSALPKDLPKRKKDRFEYITDRHGVLEARRTIKSYLRQSYDSVGEEQAMLAVDFETYRKPETTNTPFKKVPKAVWLGDEWDGHIRTIQIGLDTYHEFDIRDRQYIFDVKEIGKEYIAAAFKDIIENSVLLMQHGKYELGHMDAHLDWHPTNIIDVMLISQVYWAGDRIRHSLGDQYKEFLGRVAPGLFEKYTGMNFYEYKKLKERLQKSRWDGVLTREQLRYASDDCRLLFPLYEAQTELIDDWVKKYERRLKPGEGIETILQMEFGLMPCFTSMERYGVKVDVPYYTDEVIPLMDSKIEEVEQIIYDNYPAFRLKHPKGEKHLLFKWEGSDFTQVKKDTTHVKKMLSKFFPKQKFSVTTKAQGMIRYVRVKWEHERTDKEVLAVVRWSLSEAQGYKKIKERIININSKDDLKKAIYRTTGIKPENVQEEYLKSLRDTEDKYVAKVINYVLRAKKAQTYANKYGRAILKWVTPAGYIHCNWNQIGRESNEIVSGRSSANEPPLMQIAAREMLYAWGKSKGISADTLIRTFFIADDGCVLIDYDASQVEPRYTAQITKDKTLCDVFNKGLDMHMLTGMAALGLKKEPPKGEEGSDERRHWEYVRNTVGKIVNLGLSYGMGAKGLAMFLYNKTNGKIDYRAKEDIKKAQAIIDAYFELYPGIAECMDSTEDRCTKYMNEAGTMAPFKGRKLLGRPAMTEMGRPRRFCLLADHEKMEPEELSRKYNPTTKQFYYNEFKRRKNKIRLAGYNHRIQGGCADILKMAELYIWRELVKLYNSGEFDPQFDRMVLVFHDEILVQAQKHNTERMRKIVEDSMLKALRKLITIVPVKIDGGIGPNWSAAKHGGRSIEVFPDGRRVVKEAA